MSLNERNNDRDDPADGLCGGLEQLARDLDAQRYPGRAWPVAAMRRPRRWPSRGLVALVAAAAAAAICAAAIHCWRPARLPIAPASGGGEIARHEPKAAGSQPAGGPAASQIVVVEDLDSYSFIDMSGSVPVVSFARKDTCVPTCAVAVLPEVEKDQ
jgi:hypothetical protein